MNIRTYTEQDTIFATSRLRLPREVNASMEKWNKLAHTFNARVTFIPGMERPIGPLGNYTQTLTVTIEGDCDDPQCQKLFDALYSGDPKKIELIKNELRYGRATDDASNTTNAVDQSTARNTQKNAAPLNRAIAVNSSDTTPLIKRIFMFLEDEEWDRVNEYCETVLDLDPENARAYLGMLMAELKVRYVKDLKDQAESFTENKNYQKAVRYADEKLKAGLIGCINHINTRNENERLEGLYISALEELNTVSNSAKNISEQSIQKIAELFESISHYKDAADKARECYKKIEEIRLERKRQEEIARIEDERRAREEKIAEQKTKKACAIAALIVSMFVAVVLLITNVIVPNNHYKDAVALIDAGKYEDAIELLEMLDGYKNSGDLISSASYMRAKELLEAGHKKEAAKAFYALGNYQDAHTRGLYLWGEISGWETVSAGFSHTVGLKSDGTVVAVGDNSYGQCDVSGWSNIVAISAAGAYTVGLKSDGTVVAVGDNSYGQCDVSGWSDIVDISASGDYTVGLKSDGTVVATVIAGSNIDVGQCDVSNWSDIVAISTGGLVTAGLKSDGTVVAVGSKYHGIHYVSEWTDIVAISGQSGYIIGLKSDGSVVSIGDGSFGRRDVSEWTDIIAVSAGNYHTIGLKSDGTVITTQCEDRKKYCEGGQCNISGWRDIIAISTSYYHSVGLKADGTVVAVGDNSYGQCNVSGWKDIKVPNRK